MNATFDGARIHQQELDREIESICTEKIPRCPGTEPARPDGPRPGVGGAGDDQRRDGAREPRRRGSGPLDRVGPGLTVRPSPDPFERP